MIHFSFYLFHRCYLRKINVFFVDVVEYTQTSLKPSWSSFLVCSWLVGRLVARLVGSLEQVFVVSTFGRLQGKIRYLFVLVCECVCEHCQFQSVLVWQGIWPSGFPTATTASTTMCVAHNFYAA